MFPAAYWMDNCYIPWLVYSTCNSSPALYPDGHSFGSARHVGLTAPRIELYVYVVLMLRMPVECRLVILSLASM